jgi:FkbM family methyltransferase
MEFSNVKVFVEKYFSRLARDYRWNRDYRKYSNRRMRPTSLGFDFIGVEDMPESRAASGEIQLLLDYLKSSNAFIDIGANCGLYSLVASIAGVPTLSFEPNSENYQLLLRNLHHNKINNVEGFHVALSSSQGVMRLYGGGEGASLVKNWGGMKNTYSCLVSTNSLDNLISHRFDKDQLLIKIDVEGHEFEVLSGSQKLLSQFPAPVWFIEHGFKENLSGEINPHFMDIFELFWRHGYDCFTADSERRPVVKDDVLRWLEIGERDFGYVNYLFTKKSF